MVEILFLPMEQEKKEACMKAMKLTSWVIIFFVFMFSNLFGEQKLADSKKLGEKLVRQLWENMEKQNIKAIKESFAEGFQSIHEFGANNAKEELKLIKGLKLGKYTLSDFKVSRNGDVLIVTYFVSVAETIEGKSLPKKPSPRMSIFVKNNNTWKWLAHANLRALK